MNVKLGAREQMQKITSVRYEQEAKISGKSQMILQSSLKEWLVKK